MSQTSHHIWQERLYNRLFGQPYPLFVFEDGVIPAASMWFLVREWVHRFRTSGLHAGSRVVIALPPTRTFVAVLLAGLWERYSLALCPPNIDTSEAALFLDVEAIVSHNQHDDETVITRRTATHAPTPDIRLLLASSGTTAAPRWLALSDENIFTVIDSHLPELGLVRDLYIDSTKLSQPSQGNPQGSVVADYPAARVLSVLPLHHVFGLIIDFLPALFAGAEIIRDAENGRNIASLLALMERHTVTHCSMVPLLVQRLAGTSAGRQFLCGLQGGVIGGAPVQEELIPLLRQTRLRVGYGQTEASPGITLGEAGVWRANYLGKPLPKPLGCDVQINAEGVLEFRGANACIGTWSKEGFVPFPPNRWHSTGDIVETSNDAACEGFVFVGRNDDNFKLANGRFIPAVHWEQMLLQQMHNLKYCMVIGTADGTACVVMLGFDDTTDAALTKDLGELQHRIADVCACSSDLIAEARIIPKSEWQFTPKGSIDRRKMQTILSGRL
jgi:long-subunit acyl-CoA synthetase (AMP-forming)